MSQTNGSGGRHAVHGGATGRPEARRAAGATAGAKVGAAPRRLTPEQRRRILEARRRRERVRMLKLAAIVAAVVLVAAVSASLALLPGRDPKSSAAQGAQAAETLSLADASTEGSGATDAGNASGTGAALTLDGPGTDAQRTPEGEGASAATTLEDAPSTLDGGAGAPADGALETVPSASEAPVTYSPRGGVFVYDDAYVAAALGAKTGPLLQPNLENVDAAKAARWPNAEEGYIPILFQAENTTEKIIAITVDDCFQAENLRRIVQCALDNGGKLTIFPIGSNLVKEKIGATVKWAWENGMEIENHTYHHVGMYHYDDERMINEIWMQSQALNQALGVNYQEHFFRPRGGDERSDQRVHAYVDQLGMSAIAIWTEAFLSNEGNSLPLKPGGIYLFHTTDNDMKRLLQFIPEAVSQGYQLVTLNDMFGLPANETSELTAVTDPPALEAFQIVPATLKKTSYMRAAAVVQKRLIELGWMEGDADGVFGHSSYIATGCFQLAADIDADGIAGAATQAVLFSDGAPSATEENKAKVKALLNK